MTHHHHLPNGDVWIHSHDPELVHGIRVQLTAWDDGFRTVESAFEDRLDMCRLGSVCGYRRGDDV